MPLSNNSHGILRKIVPSDRFSQTKEKINSFRNGYGSILYFEDQTIVESLQKQFPYYKDNFPTWQTDCSSK